MIRIREAATLALTKLRTRKIRLSVTIVVSGLLFAVLAGASIGAHGIFAGVNKFSSEGFSGRYITRANAIYGVRDAAYTNEQVQANAMAIHKDTVAKKKLEAKRLGIEYNESSEPLPVDEHLMPGGEKRRYLNTMHPAARQAIREFLESINSKGSAGVDDLKSIAAPYGAKAYYESRNIPYELEGARLQVLSGNKEVFDSSESSRNGLHEMPEGLDSFATSWRLMSAKLLEPFLLQGQSLQTGNDGSIPIVVPFGAAEQMLRLDQLPGNASSAQRLERLKEIRQKVSGTMFGVCYRNATSAALVDRALAAKKEIEHNKDKKDYRKPDLQYGLPDEACGSVPVVRDVRSKESKMHDAKQEQFDAIFGKLSAEQTITTFRIVGIVPDFDHSMSVSVSQIIRSMLTSGLGEGGWYTPIELASQNAIISKVFSDEGPSGGAHKSYYAEFASASQAKSFMNDKNCVPDFSQVKDKDPGELCAEKGLPFYLEAFGSNSLGLDDTKKTFGKIFSIAGLAVAAIACVIMMGTVGKMIADSRRETAVFRAIGAKKLDISQIYLIYALFVAALIAAFAFLIGLLVALWADSRWSAEATRQAILAYNVQDMAKTFKLYGFHLPDILYILGVAVVAGLASAALPLIRSLRRNPIRDMRDDT